MAGSNYEKKVKPYLAEIKEWARDHSKDQIAKRLGVGRRTLYTYIEEHEELRKALEGGHQALVEDLRSALIQKAKGFHYKETKRTIRSVDGVKTQVVEEFERYAPPDTGAIHLLLKNLDDSWRNDDRETMELKKKRLELEKEKTEDKIW